MQALYVLLFVGCIYSAQAVNWKSCGPDGVVKSVSIPGCEKDDICQLHRGQNVTFAVDFIPNRDASQAKAVVHGKIAFITRSFPLENPNACQNCGLTCPLKSGTKYEYSTAIFIQNSYPKVKGTVEWKLVDEKNNNIFCIRVPARLA